MKTNPNDPAQPTIVDASTDVIPQVGSSTWQMPGMSKREHFASLAMQAFINTGHVRVDHKSGTVENRYNYKVIAKSCVDQADALIEALNKQGE